MFVVLACAVPAALGFLLLIFHFYEREKAQLQKDGLETARVLVHAVDRDLNTVVMVATALSVSPSLKTGDYAGFHAEASRMVRNEFPGFNFVLIDTKGRQLVNTVRPFGPPLQMMTANVGQLVPVFSRGKVVISDVFVGDVLRRPLVAIHVPVVIDGAIKYSLSVGILPERLATVLSHQHVDRERIALIADKKGTIVARTLDPANYVGKPISPLLRDRIAALQEDTADAVTAEGVPVYSMFSRSAKTGWTVAVGIPKSKVLVGLLRSLLWVVLPLLVLFSCGFITAWILARRISGAVRGLTAAAADLGSGRPLALQAAPFSEAFDASVTLKRVESELSAHRHQLEKLVAERTIELNEANEQLRRARDATENANSLLRTATAEAQAANRAKSVFVANMSHELRTPMNAVLGVTHLLDKTELSPRQRHDVDMIRSAGQSLLGIINNILDFSKIEAGKVELSTAVFHLSDTIRNLADIMSMCGAGKDIELAIGVAPDVPRLLVGDALRLQQVLVNLAGNAIKFTEQGEVCVLVEIESITDDVVVLHFAVKDTGIGITDAQQKNLFKAFAQADVSTTRRFGGTGLGLTITKGLVEVMGGKIRMESTPGQGSRFHFAVPFALGHRGTTTQAAAANGPRLLIVDPHASSRECIAMAAVALGYDAVPVASGRAAVQALRGQSAASSFDVLLVDRHIGDIDMLMRQLAVHAPGSGAPPLAVMANAYEKDTVCASASFSAASAFLAKPVCVSQLSAVVDQLLGRFDSSDNRIPAQTAASIDARILLVEDNQMNQFVAVTLLESAGATVTIASNGKEALDLLASDGSAYDLILMDIQMPVMDGFEATRLIRSELKLSLPVIAMTAGVMESERDECVAAGMDDFIAKPIDVNMLLAVIARHVVRGVAMNGTAAPFQANHGHEAA